MTKRFSIGVKVVLAGLMLSIAVGGSPASGAATRFLTIAVAGMADRVASEHNDGNAAFPDACAAQIAKTDIKGDENRSDLNNAEGSYLAPVSLPQRAKVTGFSLFANDNDDANDVHAYLARNTIGAGIPMPGESYEVMAEAQSTGAQNNVLRKFTDATIANPQIDNATALYFVELVVCPTTEPYAIQIAYKK